MTEYRDEVKHKRLALIRDILRKFSGVRLLVVYELSVIPELLGSFTSFLIQKWRFGKQLYCLYGLQLDDSRTVYLLNTPFFGNGQISYAGIRDCIESVKNLTEVLR